MQDKMQNHNSDKNKEVDKKEEKTITLKESEYAKLKEEAQKSQEYWDRILRLQAEFENAKKRLEKEKLEFVKFANEGLILEFLTILDDLERTMELAQKNRQDFNAFLKGAEMILAHLYDMLKKNGVSVIESEGKYFDHSKHEALMREETNEVPENTVIEEFQKGYMINDRVLRTAKVKVAIAKKTGEIKEEKT